MLALETLHIVNKLGQLHHHLLKSLPIVGLCFHCLCVVLVDPKMLFWFHDVDKGLEHHL